ncbi:MAG: hypothetical protein RLZZ360_571 [Candidatus Parcubacteria bacterium]|jgi:heat shock protein HslJ
MKKYLFAALGVVLLAVVAGIAYWYFFFEPEKPPRYTRDPNAWTIPPVAFSMKGKTFVVPDQPDTKITLNLIYPSATRDYPMSRFTLATGTGEGQLYAMDDFATDLQNGRRAVPIVVSTPGTGAFVYLALIDETDTTFNHATSVFLGDRIRVTKVTREGNNVTVTYFVHDRNQAMTEVPGVQTSAIIDITTGTFIQEGRKPWQEAALAAKEFKGNYLWRDVTKPDGTVVKPSTANVFTMLFDGPRVSLGTDCNTGSSEYVPPTGTSSAMSFGAVAATKKFCDSKDEGPYFEMISQIKSYAEAENGNLSFTLADGSTMVFVREGTALEYADDAAAEGGE